MIRLKSVVVKSFRSVAGLLFLLEVHNEPGTLGIDSQGLWPVGCASCRGHIRDPVDTTAGQGIW